MGEHGRTSLKKQTKREKAGHTDVTGIFSFQSDRAGNFTRAQAAGAGVDILRGTVHDRLHALDIGVPGTVAPTMRVRNLDTERDTLATARTFGHNCLHLLFNSFNSIAYDGRKCKCFRRFFLNFFHNFAFLLNFAPKYCVLPLCGACFAAVSTI